MNLMNKVNIEEIFKTITDLEGPKYPLDNMDELNNASEYILNKLKSYGIKTEIQEFYVKGITKPFKNIVGIIGDQSKPAIVLGSHYDTVRDCPGANDNISSVAVSLEVARVLNSTKNPPSVIIAVFTLEEAHPGINKALEDKLIKLGIHDLKHRFKSASMLKFSRDFWKIYNLKRLSIRRDFTIVFKETLEALGDNLTKEEINYVNTYIDVYKEFEDEYSSDKLLYSLGSQEFVRRVQIDNTLISNIVNFDCLGWISNDKASQKRLPIGKEVQPMVKTYKTDLNANVGNFIGVMGEKKSNDILNIFLKQCESNDIDIPYFGITIPMEYKDIVKMMPNTLRSDHAPFWKVGIPGIFISDTANFRSDFYHTPADTYNRLDYISLGKITKATINSIIEYNLIK